MVRKTPASWGEFRPSIITATFFIHANGSIASTGTPPSITVNRWVITFLAPYTGSIADERNDSTLDGAGKLLTYSTGTAAITVSGATNVTVKDFHISSAGTTTAVEVLGSSGVLVLNNSIASTGPAVGIDSSSSVDVTSNLAMGSAGLTATNSSGLRVVANNFWNSSGDGILVGSSSDVAIFENNASHARLYGLDIFSCGSVDIESNDFAADGIAGVILSGVGQGNVSFNRFVGTGYPITVEFSANLSLWDNLFRLTSLGAFLVRTSSGITIGGSSVSGVRYGALLISDHGVRVQGVSFPGNFAGVAVENSSSVSIDRSSLVGGTNGIYALDASGLSISRSDLTLANNGLFAINSSEIRVLDSTLSRANYPINLTGGTRDVLVENSSLAGAQIVGVYLNGVSNITVDHCALTGAAQFGLVAVDSRGITLSSSDLSGTRSRPEPGGVSATRVTGLSLRGDTIGWTAIPFVDHGSNRIAIDATDLSNATGVQALTLYSDGGVSIAGSNFFNDTGRAIDATYVSGLSIAGSMFVDVHTVGVFAYQVSDLAVIGNTFVNLGGNAIYGVYASAWRLEGNRFNATSYDLFLTSGFSVTFAGNLASSEVDGGLSVSAVTGLTIAGNQFHNEAADVTALSLLGDTGCLVTTNTIGYVGEALRASNTACDIVGNAFVHDNVSVDFAGGDRALIYHNDFVDDAHWKIQNAPTLLWDNGYPSGGNYWSNYSGPDRSRGPGQDLPGADGIGDVPEVLTPADIDHYPLMTPWSDHIVRFTESGLPTASDWTVLFHGSSLSSQNSTIVARADTGVSGPFDFLVPSVGSYVASPSSGTGVIGLGVVSVTVVFAEPTVPVTFEESGLPTGIAWSVAVSGVTRGNASASLVFDLPNGTATYVVGAVAGFSELPHSGTVSVAGIPLTIAVTFTPFTYPVTFLESGLPAGVGWSVSLDGKVSNAAAGILLLNLVNGSYSFAVAGVNGYLATPTGGLFQVSGGAVTVYLSYSAKPTSGGNSATSSNWWIVAVALVVVVAAVGWFMALRRRGGGGPQVTPSLDSSRSPPMTGGHG